MFHVSMLRKYTPDPAHVVDWGEITVNTDRTFEEGPVRIMDNQDQIFATQDREASEGIVATPRSGGGNMETLEHDACHLSFPI